MTVTKRGQQALDPDTRLMTYSTVVSLTNEPCDLITTKRRVGTISDAGTVYNTVRETIVRCMPALESLAPDENDDLVVDGVGCGAYTTFGDDEIAGVRS